MSSHDLTKNLERVDEELAERPRTPVAPPSVDIYESPNGFTLLANMPGANRDSIDIRLDKGTLTVRARTDFDPPEGSELLRAEFQPTAFERHFTVSDDIDPEGIEATYADGVLAIELAKRKDARPRRIEVK